MAACLEDCGKEVVVQFKGGESDGSVHFSSKHTSPFTTAMLALA